MKSGIQNLILSLVVSIGSLYPAVASGRGTDVAFKVEIEHVAPNKNYSMRVVLTSSESVEFGSMTADSLGRARAEFLDAAITSILPGGKDVSDFAKVQIVSDGAVVLEGKF